MDEEEKIETLKKILAERKADLENLEAQNQITDHGRGQLDLIRIIEKAVF